VTLESSSDDEALEYDEELYLAFADESSESSNDDDDNDNNNETMTIMIMMIMMINDNDDEDAFAILCNFIGGVPFWLRSDALPSDAQIECEQCHVPLVQLMQLYAPLGRPHRFGVSPRHSRVGVRRLWRPLSSASVAVAKSQCVLRGGDDACHKSSRSCSGCGAQGAALLVRLAREEALCALHHAGLLLQTASKGRLAQSPRFMRSSVGRVACAALAPASPAAAAPRVTLPRLHFVTEPEPTSSERIEARREKDAAAMKNAKLVTSEEAKSFPDDELDEAVSEQTQGRDVLYARFQRRVAAASEQLVRYWHWDGTGDVCERGDEQVLWATSSTRANVVAPSAAMRALRRQTQF
jgi:hypothetical protein